MDKEASSPLEEAGAPDNLITLFVDEVTIERIFNVRSLRMRVLCSEKNFSLLQGLRRTDRIMESSEEETYNVSLPKGEFEKICRSGARVHFINCTRDAFFEVCGPESSFRFSSETPLLESMQRRSREEKVEWL